MTKYLFYMRFSRNEISTKFHFIPKFTYSHKCEYVSYQNSHTHTKWYFFKYNWSSASCLKILWQWHVRYTFSILPVVSRWRNNQWSKQHIFMIWIRSYKQMKQNKKRLIHVSKMSVDTKFTFSTYAWLGPMCVSLFPWILCWMKSRIWDSPLKKCFHFTLKWFQPSSLGKWAS